MQSWCEHSLLIVIHVVGAGEATVGYTSGGVMACSIQGGPRPLHCCRWANATVTHKEGMDMHECTHRHTHYTYSTHVVCTHASTHTHTQTHRQTHAASPQSLKHPGMHSKHRRVCAQRSQSKLKLHEREKVANLLHSTVCTHN